MRKNLNQLRLKLILKAYLSVSDISVFCCVGVPKAQEIYNELKEQTEAEIVRIGNKEYQKHTCKAGIRTSRVLNYIEMKEVDVIRLARVEQELQKEKKML